MMVKKFLSMGLDKYEDPSTNLSGCVNDSNSWIGLLRDVYGFDDIKQLTDLDVNTDNVKTELDKLIRGADGNDLLVFHYSGHGTWVKGGNDVVVDEKCDECWYLSEGGLLKDDWIRETIATLNSDAKLIVISDSCHSGTMTRMVPMPLDDGTPVKGPIKKRYHPHERGEGSDPDNPVEKPQSGGPAFPESQMKEILLSGCSADQTSKEANVGGQSGGAMTTTAVRLIRQNPQITWRQLQAQLVGLIESRFDQTPQLEGTDANKDLPVFTRPGGSIV